MTFNINSPTFWGLGSGFFIMLLIVLIILGLPLFFIWRRLFKKFIKTKRKRVILICCATAISTPLVLAGICSFLFFWEFHYPKLDFNRQKWIDNKDERYEFAEDIINSKMLIGKTKTDVEKLLGNDHFKEDDNDWFYDLGFTPGSIDPDSIEIEFKNGKVESVLRHEHH